VLAERGGIDPSTAFDRLRRYARGRRRRLHDVAGDVVQGGLSDAVLACTSDCSPTSGD
jgi:AmiR/NasT family two-component response regulator